MLATFFASLLPVCAAFVIEDRLFTDALTDPECTFSDTYPRQYVAGREHYGEIQVDGALDEKAWDKATWSEEFVDIASDETPRFRTRVKLLWDDAFLYVAAELQEPNVWANISSTCHCNSSSEDQVIFHDNDFEVFVDCEGSTHNYKEFEVNAVNSTWDLLLNRAYDNGGSENSSRVFGPEGFDLLAYGLRSATRVYGGLNDPSKASAHDRWTAEIALPLDGLMAGQPEAADPRRSQLPAKPVLWRINFSRVEWRVSVHGGKYIKEAKREDNWVWQRQGEVAMHLPERWGFVQFSNSYPTGPMFRSPDWTVRQVAVMLYYAQSRHLALSSFTRVRPQVSKG